MKITEDIARELRPGQTVKDDEVPGLELRARATAKSWQVYYRFNGQQRRPKIGSYPALSPPAARRAARAVLETVARGEDPSAERQQRRAAATVLELGQRFSDYLGQRVDARAMKARTIEGYRRHMQLHIMPALGRLKVDEVLRADVSAILDKIAAKHPTNANRVRATLSAMFKFAEREGLRPQKSSPVFGTLQRRERKRRRYATAQECAGLSVALASLKARYPAQVAALLTILYAGTRVTELVTARHSQMRGTRLVLDEHKTERTGDERVIYLPLPARELIAQVNDGTDYLFGAALALRSKPRMDVYRVWAMARTMAGGCPDLRVQDLRRTFASAAASEGASLKQIGDVFGHEDADTTQHYAFFIEGAAKALVEATGASLAKMLPSLPAPATGPGNGGDA